ncbi:MAG: UxaA family hydrolase [Alphaproteobacteria bacterium]|nr:UxaA family hydrolase [Alphaproteobacteria bacterium]
MPELHVGGFLGFRRADGRVGTRNHVAVLSILGLVTAPARRIAQAVRGTLLVASPYGRGQFGEDKLVHERQLVGLGRNPNVAAVLVVGADRVTADRVAAGIAQTGKPVEVVALDDVHEDSLALSALGIRCAAALVRAASRQRREPCAAADLFLGVECGHSDATSGLGANPLAGAAVDRVVDAGGKAVFGETVEWLGAEQLLARRAATPQIGQALVDAVARREAAVAATGFDLTGNNPGQENIRGGLSTIEEKSLGAIAKGGTRPIQGVLAIAEAPARPGLYVMDAPAFSPESLTGFASSGANLMLFTTGAGNSFCNALAPTIKISVRPDTAGHLPHQIDFDGSAILAGEEEIDAAGARLFALILAVASGERSWGEILDEGEETFIRVGGSL